MKQFLRQAMFGLLVLSGASGLAAAQPAPKISSDAPLQLPKVTVSGSRLSDFPPIPPTDLSGGGLAPSEPPVSLFFPGRAYEAGLPRGFATVCVELDEAGRAVDYLLIAYTEKYFGDALLRSARGMKYSPLLFRGKPVPSRFNFGYEFRPQFTVALNSFEAAQNRQWEVRGGRPEFKFQPVTEEDLDAPLEFERQAVPNFPAGYTPAGSKADTVMVTFFVDETGRVRIPRVDSAVSPLLVPNAIKAAHFWKFKPPTVKGKPVLVYAAFAMSFLRAENDPAGPRH